MNFRYGPASKNSDSAVNILLDVVQDQSGKTYKMDHYATRWPTSVLDIGDFLLRLSSMLSSIIFLDVLFLIIIIFTELAIETKRPIPPILHYSAEEPFTKYEMCLVFAKLLGLPHTHIIPDAAEPAPGSTPRPRDCKLYTHETEELMQDRGGLGWTPFEEYWSKYLIKA
jgi:S-adenosylmethionine synthetase